MIKNSRHVSHTIHITSYNLYSLSFTVYHILFENHPLSFSLSIPIRWLDYCCNILFLLMINNGHFLFTPTTEVSIGLFLCWILLLLAVIFICQVFFTDFGWIKPLIKATFIFTLVLKRKSCFIYRLKIDNNKWFPTRPPKKLFLFFIQSQLKFYFFSHHNWATKKQW